MARKTKAKETMSRAQVTIPLEIPDVRILKTEWNKRNDLVITVESINTLSEVRTTDQEITWSC